MHTTIRTATALSLAVFACACGRAKEKTADAIGEKIAAAITENAMKQNGQNASVDIQDGKINIKTGDGSVAMASGEDLTLPSDFPKAVPIYAGAKVSYVITTPEGANAIFSTPDAAADVTKFYRTSLEGAGWTSQMNMQTPDGDVLAYQKDKEAINVMIGRGEDKTTLTVTYSKGE